MLKTLIDEFDEIIDCLNNHEVREALSTARAAKILTKGYIKKLNGPK